jgi:DNA repair protein RecO (recombination protein O)
MIVKTEAIVLSAMNYRDSSKIVRLYTRQFGKISVIAKGAREAKSKFRSSLEPMSYVTAVIYKSDNRELQLLSQCDAIVAFYHLTEDMEKMSAAMSVVELVDIVTHDEEQNDNLFTLLLNHLHVVNSATKSPIVALYYFETQLAVLLGLKPDLHKCSFCQKRVEGDMAKSEQFLLLSEGILCYECSENSPARKISASSLRVMQRMQEVESVESIMSLQLTPLVKEEVGRSLREHLQHHIEGFRGLRSEEVFGAIL